MSFNQSMDFVKINRHDVGDSQHRSFILNATYDGNITERFSTTQNVTLGDVPMYTKLDSNEIKIKTNRLHDFFLEIAQSRTNEAEIFDTVENMIQACTEISDDIFRNGGLTNDNQYTEWLNQERNTWKLLYCLYKDRLLNQNDGMDDGTYTSEKEIIEKLYEKDGNLREHQLIVDWLEQCETQQRFDKFGHFMDETVSWENTLHQLQNIDRTVFSVKKNIVKSLDPDAPHREKLPLHDLDAEDEERISKEILFEIRQGHLDEAGSLCERVGQWWRAAVLEGWRLHHDPNYKPTNTSLEKYPIEGNPRRDLWKKLAWKMAENSSINDYTRAYLGVFCGHLDSLKAILNASWFDLLWAYLKVQIDIRVESELQHMSSKSYVEMPDKYWKNKMSIEEIFTDLSTRDNIRAVAEDKMTIIQKCLILDDVQELMRNINQWLDDLKTDGQMLRFIAHIVLFMRQIQRLNPQHEDIGNRAIKTYVEYLIHESNEPVLVAFYTAAIPSNMQINLYAQFLQQIHQIEDRKCALDEAHRNHLDVHQIVNHMVYTVCSTQSNENVKELTGTVSTLDERKISTLEWLTFHPEQFSDLLWFANALIRNFLGENKIESIRKIFRIIPQNVVQRIQDSFGSKEYIPAKVECSIFEYACYLLYVDALDSYNDWLQVFHNKPKEPEALSSDAPFTERMANEHKKQTYLSGIENWRIDLQERTSGTQSSINKALFPSEKGFLVDPDTINPHLDDDKMHLMNRIEQLNGIRKLCIPQLILLLHNILHSSGKYKEAIQIIDDLVSETCQLYEVYSKHQLTEIIGKISESSLAALNEKLDPWGYDTAL